MNTKWKHISMINKIETYKHNSVVNRVTARQIKELQPHIIHDIGPGDGYYGKLVQSLGLCPQLLCTTAVEINEEYIDKFQLNKIYDIIIVKPVENVIDEIYGDLIIFGDVLEHMEKPIAMDVLRRSVSNFKHIIINSPFGFVPQDHECTYEIHRCGIYEEDFKDYDVMNYKVYENEFVTMFNCLIKGGNYAK